MNRRLTMKDQLSDVLSYILYFRNKECKYLSDLAKFLELKSIMRNNLLTTFFQPIIDLENGSIFGYEALNRPPSSRSFASTEKFYDYIGKTNQVFLFDLLCRNQAISKFYESVHDKAWCNERFLFINIHPQVLMDSDYKSGETTKLLRELDIPPKQVIFEITEKQAVTDYVLFEKVLSHYRSQGFRIAVDDAGSGFNSLKAIVHLKPEILKLDRSLIHNITQSNEQQKMTKLLLDFAIESGTKIVAEGIEQQEDLNYLRELGIHYGQGYKLGRPSELITS
ncbi:EAL domain-containing protein [Evansella sp. AB-rgal1]|uniref:EAL domain-containing protein n=1 Tax=Evansella sp. AB-rgal1 TaxID=3242696 RepID=UPI00359E6778